MEPNPTPDYATLNEWLTQAEARLEELNTEFNAPRQGFAYPAPRPEGVAPLEPVAKQRTRTEIQQDKDQEKADTFERIKQATEQAPLATRQQLRDESFGRLYAEEIQRVAAQEWDSPEANWGLDDKQTQMWQEISEFRQRQRENTPSEPRLIDQLTDRFWEKSSVHPSFEQGLSTPAPAAPEDPDEPEK